MASAARGGHPNNDKNAGWAGVVRAEVSKDGKLFDCHKFRTMRVAPEPLKGSVKKTAGGNQKGQCAVGAREKE